MAFVDKINNCDISNTKKRVSSRTRLRSGLRRWFCPCFHHMSAWLPRHSRRSRPDGTDGAAGQEESRKSSPVFFNLHFVFVSAQCQLASAPPTRSETPVKLLGGLTDLTLISLRLPSVSLVCSTSGSRFLARATRGEAGARGSRGGSCVAAPVV